MSECDDGGDKTTLPDERAQPPQPIQTANKRGPAALDGPVFELIIDGKRMKRQRAWARKRTAVLDHARFTAGIVGLYEAVLSEPVPEKMLHLIEEISKRERKS